MIRTLVKGWRDWLPAAILAAAILAPIAAQAAPSATSVRAWQHPDHTRFVLELSDTVTYRMFSLADPHRLVIDLPEIAFALPPKPLAPPVGLIAGFRYGLFEPGRSRIVLDLSAPATVVRSFVLPPGDGRPHRLVIDLTQASDVDFRRSIDDAVSQASLPVPPPPPPAPPPPTPQAAEKPLIVLDPGHGGVDPGAVGVSGVFEKDIVLGAARQLRDALDATGRYRVMMTRDRDIFLRLQDRVDIARNANADLFISLHADAISDRQHRGASIYTLSKTRSDAEAEALAAKENKADIIAGVDLSDQPAEVTSILIDLAQRVTNDESVRIAVRAVEELRRHNVPVLRKAHRHGPFRVLTAPEVPSILVELGYLSNSQDEKMLTDPASRRKAIDALVAAVDAYFTEIATGSW